MKSPITDKFALPEGEWRFDPFRRIKVWVPSAVVEPEPDAFDIAEAEAIAPKQSFDYDRRDRPNTCIDCGKSATRGSLKCLACYTAEIAKARESKPKTKRQRLGNGIDRTKVAAILDGKFSPCNRAERLEVNRQWHALGRSGLALVHLTGWNVPRDKRLIEELDQQKEVAA